MVIRVVDDAAHSAWCDPSLTPARARHIQNVLAPRVDLAGAPTRVDRVVGVDTAFRDGGRVTLAAACVLAFPGFKCIETAIATAPTRFPYVPGLLAFRELPAVVPALERLRSSVDVIVCDGHGVAHPRRFGLGCHIGLLTGVPTLGVAKSRYVGTHDLPGRGRGDWRWLYHRGEAVASVLRSRTGVRPVFVSPGHRMDQARARELALRLAPRYRLPEPTRAADWLAGRV